MVLLRLYYNVYYCQKLKVKYIIIHYPQQCIIVLWCVCISAHTHQAAMLTVVVCWLSCAAALDEASENELYEALDYMQEVFFYLALRNTRRTARLCGAPEMLACWALEILKEQAEAALKFVNDYDAGSLGLADILDMVSSDEQVRLTTYHTLCTINGPNFPLPSVLLVLDR